MYQWRYSMNLKTKFLAIAIVSASFITLANQPSFSKDMTKMDLKRKTTTMTMTPEMMTMAMTTMENNKNMMMMGSKMMKDGNAAGDADKMMMGSKMMHMSMMTMHMG